MSLSYPYLSGVLSLVAISCVQAQSGMNVSDHLLIKEVQRAMYGAPEEKYEGSPYLEDNFAEAHVYSGSRAFDAVLMRYDIFHNVMEFKTGNQKLLLLDADPRITRLEIGNQIFVVEAFKFNGKKQNWFMELLEPGRLTLLAKNTVSYRKKVEFGSVPAKYARLADIYYCKIGNEMVFKVSTLKNLIGSLPTRRDELTRFVSEQGLSSKNKDDLLKFVRYYNSLVPVE